MPERVDVIVVGAGAAGILAAWRAASLGRRVVILEKTSRIGTKILVSGGGKCNVAHAGSLESVLKAFRPNEARFLRPACYRFPNTRIVEMLTERGLRVYTRDDGRVFPMDQTAKDVVAILRSYLEDAGVEVRLESPVTGLILEGGRAVGVRYREAKRIPVRAEAQPKEVGAYRPSTAKNLLRDLGPTGVAVDGEDHALHADVVIVAAGGSSYPNSGTTGDGYTWARELGHTVCRVRAALAPIYLELEEADKERSGVALRDVTLKARQGKEIARWRGDLLFTHQGLSGPTVLGVSRVVEEHLPDGPVSLEVDLRPDDSFESLTERIREAAEAMPRRLVSAHLEDHLPTRLHPDLLAAAQIDPQTPNSRLDRKARNRLVECLKAWRLGKVRHVPLEKGEVVAGGIDLDEVDPHTMASRLVPGLKLCGEVLDIAGPVGGYNLQAAFATGFVAGDL